MSGDEPTDMEAMDGLEPLAGEQLERAMARYARVRLEPSPAQVRRARSAAMEAAWRARLEAAPAKPASLRPFRGWGVRRLGLTATAAVLAGLLIGSSAFAASRAGGPLYDARIAFENATLPADPTARLQAQIANAQVRLAEAYDAEARGDAGALVAALRAYQADAMTLATTSGPNTGQALAAAEQHRDVLLALIQRGAPAAALPGLDQALQSSDNAIQRLTDTDAGRGGTGSGGNPGGYGSGGGNPGGNGNGNGNAGGNGNGNAGGNGNGNAGGNGGAGGNGAATSAPGHSAAPTPTSKPDVTPNPGHATNPPATNPPASPKPGHTPNPGNGVNSAPQPSASPGQP